MGEDADGNWVVTAIFLVVVIAIVCFVMLLQSRENTTRLLGLQNDSMVQCVFICDKLRVNGDVGLCHAACVSGYAVRNVSYSQKPSGWVYGDG